MKNGRNKSSLVHSGLRVFIPILLCVIVEANWVWGASPEKKENDAPKTENIETVLSTLKETLEENLKIRKNTKALQEAFEKAVFENDNLKNQIRQLETQTSEERQKLNNKIAALGNQLREASGNDEHLQSEKKRALGVKENLERQRDELNKENERLKKILSDSILKKEKEELITLLKNNHESTEEAFKKFSDVNRENQQLKEELAQNNFAMGNIYFGQRNYEAALELYQKTLEWNPAFAWAHHNMGIIYDYYLDDRGAAVSHYEKYLNYKAPEEQGQEIRRRILDLNLLDKVSPDMPLKPDFEKLYKESRPSFMGKK